MKLSYSLEAIAQCVDGYCDSGNTTSITGISGLSDIKKGTLTFITKERYLGQLNDSAASAVILKPEWLDKVNIPAIVVDDPYLAYAKASQLFKTRPDIDTGIHASAIIDASAVIAESACIAAGVVIEKNARIGENTIIGANTVVGANSVIGSNSYIFANVSIYHDVIIGNYCEISSGTVIGADGFGFAPSSSGWQAIAQNGGVIIDDYVYIGANTTVDRGAIDPTRIKQRVIIDNQVQIAHNVVIGENTAIAGCAGIAGSTVVGKNCSIAGGAGIVGHVSICDNTQIGASTRITKSITEPGVYVSGTPFMKFKDWRKAAARYARSIKSKL